MDSVNLSVGGKIYEGWESVSIKHSLKAVAGSFELTLIDKWANTQEPWRIIPGDTCSVSIDDDDVITGYIDSVKPSVSKDARSISVSGRDKTGDIVDSSAIQTPGNWLNISLERLAKILCAPFGIEVSSTVSLSPLDSWIVNPGETVFACLDRAAKFKGVLLTNDGEGNLLITRPSTERSTTELVQGRNVLSASANYELKDRFHKYIVKGQKSYDFEATAAKLDFSAQGSAIDETVKREARTLLINAESAITPELCKTRAQWEATVRAAKGSSLECSVQGWRQKDGSLWKPNQLVRFDSAWLGVNSDFLISSVELKRGTSDGTTTHLELERSDAYKPAPIAFSKKDLLAQLLQREMARQ